MISKNESFSKLSASLGITKLSMAAMLSMKKNSVRVVNYHDVPPDQIDQFEQQIELITDKLDPITPDELKKSLIQEIPVSKPSVVFTFDDGFVSHATYVADILKSKGISGWFFLPTAAPTIPAEDQAKWAVDHQVLRANESAEIDGRTFASWEDWRRVNEHHVIASHTHTHKRFGPEVTENEATYELETSYALLSSELGIQDRYFCWVGGEKTSYGRPASDAVLKTNTSLAFTTCSMPVVPGSNPLRIERTNLESHFSDDRVMLSLSGIVDLKYISKRKLLNPIFSDSLKCAHK